MRTRIFFLLLGILTGQCHAFAQENLSEGLLTIGSDYDWQYMGLQTDKGLRAFDVSVVAGSEEEKFGHTYATVDIELPDWTKSLLYRQEGKKVYRYDEATDGEVLVLDFGLEVGDVFTRADGVAMQVVEVGDTVLVIDHIASESPERRKLVLQEVGHPERQDVWLEGVGSVNTGILLTGDVPDVTLLKVQYRHAHPSYPQEADLLLESNGEQTKMELLALREDNWATVPEGLHYEFADDSLHIWGLLKHRMDSYFYGLWTCHHDGNGRIFNNFGQLFLDFACECENELWWLDVRFGRFPKGTYLVERLDGTTVELVNGDTPNLTHYLTGHSEEGVPMLFSVLDETAKNVKVGTWEKENPAIDKSARGTVTIPAEVDGYKVVEVGWQAFSGCAADTIVVPEGVETIGMAAVYDCPNLKCLSLPSTVKHIEKYALTTGQSMKSIVSHISNPSGVLDTAATDLRDTAYEYIYQQFGIPERTTLYVPYGTKGRYQQEPVWSDFTHIVELDPDLADSIPAIGTSSADATPDNLTPILHDLTGRRLTTPPAKGVYIENGVKRVR